MKRMTRAAAQIGLVVSAFTLSGAASGAAPAETDTRVVARLDDAGRTLLYRACHGAEGDPSCSLTSGAQRLALDAAAGAVDTAHAVFAPIRVGARTALHVTVPLLDVSPAERAWEAVLVPAPAAVVAAGLTGWTRGESGERSGLRVVELPSRPHGERAARRDRRSWSSGRFTRTDGSAVSSRR